MEITKDLQMCHKMLIGTHSVFFTSNEDGLSNEVCSLIWCRKPILISKEIVELQEDQLRSCKKICHGRKNS